MADQPPRVQVDVLGPLRLSVAGAEVGVPGPKRRAVLALLALAEGRPVTVDALVDALWPGGTAESARQALHTHISRLRGHLGPAASRLQTLPDAYRLALEGDDLDLARARALLASARRDVVADPAAAMERLEEARGLWRGAVLAEIGDVAGVESTAEGCARLHREVLDALVESAVGAGRAREVLTLSAGAVAEDPLREPAVLLHMRALASTGEAPEALRIGREHRRRLADETGLDPSPALSDLERDIARGAAGPAASTPTGAIAPATRLIGREAEVAALHRLLAAERLVSVVGPGGVGKTRLVLEVARHDEAATVLLLAPVTDAAGMPHALAAALNLTVTRGDVLAACVAVLGTGPALLVVDNCEHLLEGARDTVDVLLSSCPDLRVLATSREPLGLAAEYAFRLSPLPLPGARAGRAALDVPSVAVFLQRAERVRRGPAPTEDELRTVTEIVQRLDGMPLAIELAAGRLSTFSLADLHSRLDRALDLLASGRPGADARHRTLRATLEWSYELLPEEERRLFRHLAEFPDGVDLDDAEQLAVDLGLTGDPGSLLAHLVEASMIVASFEGGTRYRMLETLRTFGRDRLRASGEQEEAAVRMVRWGVAVTAAFAVAADTEQEAQADATLRREMANLRAVWRTVRSRGAVDEAAAMMVGLLHALTYRDLIEMRTWAEELAADPALTGHPREAFVLASAAEAVYLQGRYLDADRLARTSLDRAAGDREATWLGLTTLSVADLARGAHAEAVEHALAAADLGVRPGENLGLAALATAYSGDATAARRHNALGWRAARSPSMRAWAEYVDGEIETSAGRRDLAEPHYVRSVALARGCGATFLVGVATVGLLAARAETGRVMEALRGYREVLDYFARAGNWTHLWVALRNLADLLRRLGDDEPARLIDEAADHAPDSPAREYGDEAATADPPAGVRDRQEVLEVARQAIARHLDDA